MRCLNGSQYEKTVTIILISTAMLTPVLPKHDIVGTLYLNDSRVTSMGNNKSRSFLKYLHNCAYGLRAILNIRIKLYLLL